MIIRLPFLTFTGLLITSGLLLTIFMHIQTLSPGFNEQTLAGISQGCWIVVPLMGVIVMFLSVVRARLWRSQTNSVIRALIILIACAFLYVLFTNFSNSVYLSGNQLSGGVLWEQKDGSHVLQNHGTVLRKLNEQEYLIRASRDCRSETAALLLAYIIFGAGWFVACWGKPAEMAKE